MKRVLSFQSRGCRSTGARLIGALALVICLVAGATERAHAGSFQSTVHFQRQVGVA